MYSTNFDIAIADEDELGESRWGFSLMDGYQIVLNYYTESRKESNRHKLKTVKHWNRLDQRNNSIFIVPLPDKVVQNAKQHIMTQLVVRKEYKP